MAWGSELSGEIKRLMTEGLIVDGNITCWLLKEEMSRHGFHWKYLIDGFPRNIDNVNTWYKHLG